MSPLFVANQGSPDARLDTKNQRITALETKSTAAVIDRRFTTPHKFIGTSEESFINPLNRVPKGVMIAGQDKAAKVFVNILKSDKRRIYATSDTPAVTVTFVPY